MRPGALGWSSKLPETEYPSGPASPTVTEAAAQQLLGEKGFLAAAVVLHSGVRSIQSQWQSSVGSLAASTQLGRQWRCRWPFEPPRREHPTGFTTSIVTDAAASTASRYLSLGSREGSRCGGFAGWLHDPPETEHLSGPAAFKVFGSAGSAAPRHEGRLISENEQFTQAENLRG